MSWTVKDIREMVNNPEIPDDAVLHIQINKYEIEQVDAMILMIRPELYPALVMSPYVRNENSFETIDGKIIDKVTKGDL